MFEALARLADRRPGWVVLVAVAVAGLAGLYGHSVVKHLGPYDVEDSASESYAAKRALERSTRVRPTPGVVALIAAPHGIDAPATRATVGGVVEVIRRQPLVARVATVYATHDRAMVARDGRSTYVAAYFKAQAHTADADRARADAAKDIRDQLGDRPAVKLGGPELTSATVNDVVSSDLRRAELLAFPLVLLLSFAFFRGLVAAALPPLVGGLAIVISFALLRLASEQLSLSVFALNLVTGLGLGLAIDYSLFIVSRYREELAAGGSSTVALSRTLASAGRTVMFSSLTVAAALSALLIFPQRFLFSMGVGGLVVTLVAAAIALVVLPAILALLGPRLNALAPRRLRRAAEREARPESAGAWYRISRLVMRRPWPIAIASAASLIVLGLPFWGVTFTAIDATVLPASEETRQVADALDTRFPPHRTEPIYVVAHAHVGPQVQQYVQRLRDLPEASAVTPAQPLAGGTALITAFSPADFPADTSQRLVRQIRAQEPGFAVDVGGQTAEFVDQKGSEARHLPYALGLVAGVTIVVLFVMTGSVVLPLKALVMNALTLGAALGILVFVFQDGRLEGLLGYSSQGALDSSQPVLLFAIAFGLSTDYGVFLLSRIKEARDRGAPDSEAVAIGLERSGRIVTAAALLFCVAIGAFATSRIAFIKELGIGTALAVLIDATIVRALLVPSLMELLGRRNWWAPPMLRRLHGRLGLREESDPVPAGSGSADPLT